MSLLLYFVTLYYNISFIKIVILRFITLNNQREKRNLIKNWHGATTLGIMTFSITTLRIMTLRIVTLSITIKNRDTQQNGTQYCYAECRYAVRRYAECHYAGCRGAHCHCRQEAKMMFPCNYFTDLSKVCEFRCLPKWSTLQWPLWVFYKLLRTYALAFCRIGCYKEFNVLLQCARRPVLKNFYSCNKLFSIIS